MLSLLSKISEDDPLKKVAERVVEKAKGFALAESDACLVLNDYLITVQPGVREVPAVKRAEAFLGCVFALRVVELQMGTETGNDLEAYVDIMNDAENLTRESFPECSAGEIVHITEKAWNRALDSFAAASPSSPEEDGRG